MVKMKEGGEERIHLMRSSLLCILINRILFSVAFVEYNISLRERRFLYA